MAEPALQVRSDNRTSVGVESEALIAGGTAAVIGGATGAIVFGGSSPTIWGGWSIGLLAAITVLIISLVTSYVGYWRARHLAGQEWRLPLAPWKFILDATNVAAVHALIAAIGTIAVFVLLSLSFRGVTLDGWVSAASVAASAGLTCYWVYLSVSRIDTSKLSTLLVIFISVTTLTSMATASDPLWWEYHFSLLGTLGDASANLFNISLIIAGLLVTTFSLYLQRDIRALVDLGVLRGMPWTFFLATGGFFAGMVISVILFAVTGYFNLTFFELVVFMIIFGWIATFIRFLSATVETARTEKEETA